MSVCLSASALFLAAQAYAGVILTHDLSSFNSLGVVSHDSIFDDLIPPAGFRVLGNDGEPFTRGGVTYVGSEQQNVAFKRGGLPVAVLINNHIGHALGGEIATGPQYNMFGFEVAQNGGARTRSNW